MPDLNALIAATAQMPYRSAQPLEAPVFDAICRRVMLDYYKWDPQVGDINALANFPLVVRADAWRSLATDAEALAAEFLAAEGELLEHSGLQAYLGVPRAVRRTLARTSPPSKAPRVMRFDFHWTAEGWRVSEANSDVPGGYTEAGSFTALVAAHYPEAAMAGHPGHAWVDALAEAAGGCGAVALLCAPGFMEDLQVVMYLGELLRDRGLRPLPVTPEQILWQDGVAHVVSAHHRGSLALILRFYQAEWLATLPRRAAWQNFFAGARTPVANAGSAILTECKRLPLVWDKLRTPMPVARRLFPETRDPREAPWRTDEGWIVKSAFCNTGDTVAAPGLLAPEKWKKIERDVWWRPGHWLAQRRFRVLPLETPLGEVYPCLGVYTVNGCAAGIYARVSTKPVVDFQAVDTAALVEREEPA